MVANINKTIEEIHQLEIWLSESKYIITDFGKEFSKYQIQEDGVD